jgi:hypothetical protein
MMQFPVIFLFLDGYFHPQTIKINPFSNRITFYLSMFTN